MNRADRTIIIVSYSAIAFLIGIVGYEVRQRTADIQTELFNIHDRLARIEADINTWKGDY